MKFSAYLVLFHALEQALPTGFDEPFSFRQTYDLRAIVKNLPDGNEEKESLHFPTLAASELDKSLSNWSWNVNMSYQTCLHLPSSRVYAIYIPHLVRCLRTYYYYCLSLANSTMDMSKPMLRHARECGSIKFSESSWSQNKISWTINVPSEFHLNVTINFLQVTYHPSTCHDFLKENRSYSVQGLAIGHHAAICERTRMRSYLLPTNHVDVILNYTLVPDRPQLEIQYEGIIPQDKRRVFHRMLQLPCCHVSHMEKLPKLKPVRRVIMHIKTWLWVTTSVFNISMFCQYNNLTGKKLNTKRLDFIDGPIFLLGSQLENRARIGRLECEDMALPIASATLQGKASSYVYKDRLTASIGDLSIVFVGADEDLLDVNFRFHNHFPAWPYGQRNSTDYSHISPGTARREILSLTVTGRHFHVIYNLFINSPRRASPRLIFDIIEFDIVSFMDGCHSGGIFIAEHLQTVASYCSIAGIAFLNGTYERGGILFGTKSLTMIFKGYSWFARMRIIVYVTYGDCLGIANICDQFNTGRHYLKQCSKSRPDPFVCRQLTFRPCIEVARLPSDRQVFSKNCQIYFSLELLDFPEYFHFSKTLFIHAKIQDYLDVTENRSTLEELLPRVYVLWQYKGGLHIPLEYSSVSLIHQPNKEFKHKAITAYVLLRNTFRWLGMGYWFRFSETPECQAEFLDVHSHHIDTRCGTLTAPSAPQIKISIAPEVFQTFYTYHVVPEGSQFLNVAFYLSEIQQIVHGHFRVMLEWISNNMGVDKTMTYSKLQYLELKLFCDYRSQKIFITLQLDNMLSQLIVQYMSRALISKTSEQLTWEPSWNSTFTWLDDKEFCRRVERRAPCYKYHGVSNITWHEAQIWCQEERSNLISINSPSEWHAILWRSIGIDGRVLFPKVKIPDSEIMDGTLLFIGLHRIDVSTSLISVLN